MIRKRKIDIQGRISKFILFIFGIIFILVGRIGWVQLVQGDELAARIQNQVGESKTLHAPRGTIFDRNGRELAVSLMTKSLYVDPSQVKNPDELAMDLSGILGLSVEDIKEKISRGGGFVWVKRCLDEEVANQVKQLIEDKQLNCLNFQEESKRYYPNDMLAANVLGFVGMDDTGLEGIEHSADKIIKGKSVEYYVQTDHNNRRILNSVFSNHSIEKCKNVYLTLDSNIQFIVEQNLDQAMQDYHPRAVTAIVMDPKTGEVLAMANRPSYNPNNFNDYAAETFKNRSVSFIYEPGSTFKSIITAAALEVGAVTPNTYFEDPGYIMVSGRRIQNWDGVAHGSVPFTEIIKQSLNTGFVQVGLKVGAENLIKYAKAFGFGKETDVGLPGEESGILFAPEDMRDSDIATMSIGQSIAVTPIQLVTAMSAIANNGVLLKPHIIKEIHNSDNAIYDKTPVTEVRRAITEDANAELVGLLEQVVAAGGGGKAGVKGYRIAGKTGTAEKLNDNGSGYMSGHYIASFCGFAPVEDPQIVVLLIIDDPSGVYYGGQIAAPVAGKIFEGVLRYMNIKPLESNFDLKKILAEQPKSKAEATTEKPVTIPTGKVLIPDMNGKSLRQSAEELAKIKITMMPEGNGYAYKQSISPNTLVDVGTEITVYFNP